MKSALVTGASSGIGLAITRLLASEGVQVTLVARRVERLQEIIESLPANNHQSLQADLSIQDDIEQIATYIAEHKHDVLINNAGMGIYGHFEELSLARQHQMLALNMEALVTLSYTFLQRAKPGDALMNIASVLGITSFPGASAYAGTKGFVVKFSESLWYEFKDRGIYVTAFCPGVTATNFHEASGGSEEYFPQIITQTPEQVAREAVSALKERKKAVAVSGFINQSMLFSQRFLSRRGVVNMMGGFSPVKPKES